MDNNCHNCIIFCSKHPESRLLIGHTINAMEIVYNHVDWKYIALNYLMKVIYKDKQVILDTVSIMLILFTAHQSFKLSP